ncbi:MAG: SGNH/GDSL hydrolase family protein [Deltaproteobacteria bacterium]|nr:SGNH/GDSL hydrolase family protein [Candidatus Zymogenaceae bacterium]
MMSTGPAFAQPVRVIFLHHSCGHNLIEEGSVRQGLTAKGYEFYDHGYNGDGLRLADGTWTGSNFDIPGDNTDPDGLAELFGQPLNSPPTNAFSHLMEYDVIAVKSCFPLSNIGDDARLEELKGYYRTIRNRMAQYPDKTFIIVTQPPQVPGSTDASEAARARKLADWLASDEFLSGYDNIFVFDFFDLLAGSDNMLKSEYRFDNYDAHPNAMANRSIGPLFVAFISDVITSRGITGSTHSPIPTDTGSSMGMGAETGADMGMGADSGIDTGMGAETASAPTPGPSSAPVTGLIDGFETPAGIWEIYGAEGGSSATYAPDRSVFHEGSASLKIIYSLAPGGNLTVAPYYETPQNWSGSGVSFWAKSNAPGIPIIFGVSSGNSGSQVPFEVTLTVTDTWTRYDLSWSEFIRAPWYGETGSTEVNSSLIIGYGFTVDAGGGTTDAILWVDELSVLP